MRIQTKLILAFLALSLPPLLLSNILYYVHGKKALTRQILNHLESVAAIQQHRIEDIYDQNLERLDLITSRTQLRISLAQFIDNHDPAEQAVMNRILHDAQSSIKDFSSISICLLDGTLIASTDAARIGRNVRDEKFFSRGQQGHNAEIFFLDDQQNLMLYLAGPLKLQDRLLGVLVIESTAESIISSICDYTGLEQTGETIMARRDENGDAQFVMPTRFDPHTALRRIIPKQRTDMPIIRSLMGGHQVLIDAPDYRGVKVLAVTRHIGETGWGMVVKIDMAEALAPISTIRNLLLLVIAVSIAVTILLTIFLARHITLPILKLTKAARQISSGRLNVRAEETAGDETGVLARAFNDMTGRLEKTIEELRDREERILAAAEAGEEMKAQLQQARHLEAVGTLAGGIAHDFNNILTAIVGYTELAAQQAPAGSNFDRHLRQVLKAADRAKKLVKQILAFSRQAKEERKPVRLKTVIDEALHLLRASLPSGIEIRTDLDVRDITVLADPTQIHQVLMNLGTNAFQAMRESGGVLTVKLSRAEISRQDDLVTGLLLGPGIYACLEVSDTGHGMERAVMERIFDPYFTTRAKGEGTGIGLALVHGIVKSHDGHISVHSEPGKGSSFRIYLPCLETDGESSVAGPAPALPRGSEHILLVDDEEMVVEVECRILETLGYRVTYETDPEAALELFRVRPGDFDLIITDMVMPGLTGAELALQILSVNADMPIILCTGFSELIDEKKAEAIGIRRYILKPLTISEIAVAVREVLGEPKAK